MPWTSSSPRARRACCTVTRTLASGSARKWNTGAICGSITIPRTEQGRIEDKAPVSCEAPSGSPTPHVHPRSRVDRDAARALAILQYDDALVACAVQVCAQDHEVGDRTFHPVEPAARQVQDDVDRGQAAERQVLHSNSV